MYVSTESNLRRKKGRKKHFKWSIYRCSITLPPKTYSVGRCVFGTPLGAKKKKKNTLQILLFQSTIKPGLNPAEADSSAALPNIQKMLYHEDGLFRFWWSAVPTVHTTLLDVERWHGLWPAAKASVGLKAIWHLGLIPSSCDCSDWLEAEQQPGPNRRTLSPLPRITFFAWLLADVY